MRSLRRLTVRLSIETPFSQDRVEHGAQPQEERLLIVKGANTVGAADESARVLRAQQKATRRSPWGFSRWEVDQRQVPDLYRHHYGGPLSRFTKQCDPGQGIVQSDSGYDLTVSPITDKWNDENYSLVNYE
ncbi:hypothetical protein EVAR_80605_1 [Eumeta japonica]|uniref:Uncharacterized protein n=1 Tax=Eumeta variegata TaxID=151549 RepID=A0A4C1TMS1_EUMVA|nr:hypothetical protein EVAR_80605_1 [Eumeta japonica]